MVWEWVHFKILCTIELSLADDNGDANETVLTIKL